MEEGATDTQQHEEHQRGGLTLLHHVGRQQPTGVAHKDEGDGIGDDDQFERQVQMDGYPRQNLREHHRVAAVVDEHTGVVDVVEDLVGGISKQHAHIGILGRQHEQHQEAEMAQQKILIAGKKTRIPFTR